MTDHAPLILIEIVLVFGGALLFGWWQLRSIKKDQAEAADRRAQAATLQQRANDDGGTR